MIRAGIQLPEVDPGLWMDSQGRVVIGQNTYRLPEGCRKLSEDVKFTVHAGRKFAHFPQEVYGYNELVWWVKPCARVTVVLINEDQVRHQWAIRGLPQELYPKGLFALEASGGEEVAGTFIVPPEDKTYAVRSEISQQLSQGMSSQLIVGEGGEVLPVLSSSAQSLFSGTLVLGFVTAVLGAPYLLDWLGRRFFGMKGKEVSGYLFDRLADMTCLLLQAVGSVRRLLRFKT